MKKIFLKIIELLPFVSVLAVLGFIGYWQMAQYNKIEQLEKQVQQYVNQKSPAYMQPSGIAQITTVKSTDTVKPTVDIPPATTADKPAEIELPTVPTEISKLVQEQKADDRKADDILASQPPSASEQATDIEDKSELNNRPSSTKALLTDKQLNKQLKKCDRHLAAYQLTKGKNGNAFDCYTSILDSNPDNEQAIQGIKNIEKKYIKTINKYIAKNNLSKAQYFLDILIGINPQNEQIDNFRGQLSQNPEKDKVQIAYDADSDPYSDLSLKQQLVQCKNHLDHHRLTFGEGGNALECYSSVLLKHPDNKEASIGVLRIQRRYERYIKKYIKNGNLPKAERFIGTLIKINPQNKKIAVLQKQLFDAKGMAYTEDDLYQPSLHSKKETSKQIASIKKPVKQKPVENDITKSSVDSTTTELPPITTNSISEVIANPDTAKPDINNDIKDNNVKDNNVKDNNVKDNNVKDNIAINSDAMDEPEKNKTIKENHKNPEVTIDYPITTKSTPENIAVNKAIIKNPEKKKALVAEIKKQDPLEIIKDAPLASITTSEKNSDTPVATDKQINTDDSFVEIKAGCFNRNVTFDSRDICIKNNFRIGKYEVTQKLWQNIMKSNPSRFIDCGSNCPVENVSWLDIQQFIKELNKKTGKKYRLPSSNEWEYAARAGSNSDFSFGDDPALLHKYGNYCDKSCSNDWKDKQYDDGAKSTSPVGSYKPNAWGLYDVHGNVWEWVADKESGNHIYRGGSWGDSQELCQSSSSGNAKADFHVSGIGFRLIEE